MTLLGRRELTPAQQFVNLKANPLTRGDGELVRGRLSWRYVGRPSPISRAYALRIEHAPGEAPSVFVDGPDLVAIAGGRDLPHVYSQDPTRLCLYLPGTGEWEPCLLIDRTIVPWSVLWLWYFEDWLSTDVWGGGGLHPRDLPGPERERRAVRRALGRGGQPLAA